MLSKPDAGWTSFQLGSPDTEYRLSYLTDVAEEWLTQAIHGLETMDVFSVHGFCEPNRMVCTVSYWSCYVIFEGDCREPSCYDVHHLHINMMDFCKMLHNDISDNLEDWVNWDLDNDDDDIDLDQRRESLQGKLDELKRLIEKKEEYFADIRCTFF